jgi:peptide deformylase
MAKLPIVYLPDPMLRQLSAPFERVDDAVRRLANDMLETMYAKEGVGLAAVQVGILRRLLVLDIPGDDDEQRNPLVMINPKILSLGDERRVYEEGCLSIPDFRVEIERPASLLVQFTDRDGKLQELKAVGLFATAVQHEIDHLDGKLIIDVLSKLKRDILIRKFKKLAKAGELDD